MDIKTFEEIAALAGGGAPVLTVNARLARHLSDAYDSLMRERGLGAWPTPLILPLVSWARFLLDEGDEAAAVLSVARGRVLWEKIVKSDGLFTGAAQFDAGSAVAARAWAAYSLMKEYRIPWPSDDLYLTEEARALKRWAREYAREVKRRGFIDSTDVPEAAASLVEKGLARVPGDAVVVGFDEITPAAGRFLKALEGRGTKVHVVDPGAGPGTGRVQALYACEDPAGEVRRAAREARAAYEPGSRLAFIVPELERYRELIKKEFSAELDPASVTDPGGLSGAFNISLGLPLSQEPLVASALRLLSIGEGRVRIDEMSSALSSPYFSFPEAAFEAARVDARLRDDNRRETSVGKVAAMVDGAAAPALKARCSAWLQWLRDARGRKTPGLWAGDFSTLLNRLGWLKPVKLSSAEFQALTAWNKALREFATLDEITGAITRAEAAQMLSKLVGETIHQGEGAASGIQVLGLLESSGLSFDRVWLLGCHENALPVAPAPNPFIPLNLQKEHGVPRSCPERELAFARKVLSRVLSSAPVVEASYSVRVENRDVLPSPLLKGVKAGAGPFATKTHRLKDAVRASGVLEDAPEEADAPVPVGPDELEFITGGTEIIKNQSQCPFKAFATYRLSAKALREPEPGLSFSARGTVLHAALKYFWEAAQDSGRLRGMKEAGGLVDFARGIAERAIKEVRLPEPFSARFKEIESERLATLLVDWAEKELERAPFRVKKVETREEMDINGLKLRGRIDRVDELADGSEVIIDYKSGGKSEVKDWLGARPMEPQLFVYSTSGRYNAVSFARLVPGDCRFVGISKDEGTLPGIKGYDEDPIRERFEGADDWGKLMDLWKSIVHGLASDFLSGLAAVDPVKGPEDRKGPCEYCDLAPFCRVAGAELHAAKDEEAEDGQGG